MDSRVKKRKRPWKYALYGVLVALGLVGAYAGYQAYGVYNALDNFQKDETESRFENIPVEPVNLPPKWEGKERVNILLLGGDARDSEVNGIARSDSMLVVSVDPLTKKAHLFSILRDTYVNIPGHGKGRINTAITTGGPNLAMQTAGDLLGLDIQYYVYAEFEGFKSLIDAMGGIEFEVEKNMKYTDNADGNRYDIDLKKGLQVLDGDKALQYVRFRHDAMSDFTRTERQRNFMKAVAQEMQSTWNLIRMKEILESVQPYIETNLTVSDMLKLGQLGLGLHMAGSAQVPPMELISEERVGTASVLMARSEDRLLDYVKEVLAGDETLTPAPDTDNADGTDARGGSVKAETEGADTGQ
ncbi:LCP family protein [Paenibacillus sp. 598K]|uniref:LCP family protein n=1 Tax=Paenibacillus sp. 598K TaxID=1117987 RepID=UPI000FFE526F|nr:LCP family protein [Paenibacillus sp. 598K]